MQARNSDLEAEVDLRDLIRPLLRHKWWIIGVTVGMAVIAFLVSEFVLQKEYVAVSSIVFTTPAFNAVLDPRIVQTTQLPPDSKAMSDVVMADDLLSKVYQSEEMSAERKKGMTFGKFKQNFNVTLSGTSQLLLQVSDSDPQRAAQAANLWAQNATARLNRLYGTSDATLTALGQQVDNARQAWATSEKALLDYLPQSQTDSLNAQLSQAQISYNAQLARIHSLDLLLSDGHALDGRWSALAPDLPMGTGDGLSLLALQQRANEVLLCNQQAAPSASATPDAAPNSNATSSQALDCTASNGLNGLQLQLSGSDLAAGLPTVGDARQVLKVFLDGLQSQQSDLKNGLGTLEEQLTGLRTKLESAQFQMEQLTQDRDLAENTYHVLASQYANTRIELAANAQVARLAGTAVPSSNPASPKVLLNAAFAGALGLVVSVGWILLAAWLHSENEIQANKA